MDSLWRGLDRLLLGGWVGSWALFGLVIAPVVFGNLSGTVAVSVVGPTLTALHLYGAIAGPLLAGVSWKLGRPGWLVATPLLLGLLCAFSHFFITSEIELVRPSDFGTATGPGEAERFASLHAWSMRLFVVISVAILALTFLHARDDRPRPQ